MSDTLKRTTARYARLPLDFLINPTTRGWSDRAKLLSILYRGNPQRTLEGLYRYSFSYAANDLGWTVKQVAAMTEILERDGFCSVDRKTDLILLRNALAEQWPESENVLKGVINRVRALPQSHLLQEFLTLAKTHCGQPNSAPSARAFEQELRRSFGPPLQPQSEPRSEPLNHNLQSESTIHNQQSESSSRRNGSGDPECLLPKVETDEERKEAETRKRFPHLAQTAGFESIGQIRSRRGR